MQNYRVSAFPLFRFRIASTAMKWHFLFFNQLTAWSSIDGEDWGFDSWSLCPSFNIQTNNETFSYINNSTVGFCSPEVLHLGSINVSRLPDSMFNNMSLETLYLNGNQLTQVPNLKPLGKSLLNLNLDNNQVRKPLFEWEAITY